MIKWIKCFSRKRRSLFSVSGALAGLLLVAQPIHSVHAADAKPYLGFDRNDYPGDASLRDLRKLFSFTGYWLNAPPGAKTNSWIGKRQIVQDAGFGFLLLFNGRTYAEIKAAGDAKRLGESDAAKAVAAARAEGFPAHTVIFLDQEQGGRLLPEQRSYLYAWIDAVIAADFATGVYCSGIAAKEYPDVSVVTAEDIRQHAGARKIAYWVVNDSCPPSPGCSLAEHGISAKTSGVGFAEIWQYAQSPWRKDFARSCKATYNKDGNCYPPRTVGTRLQLDLNVADSEDPSHGRTR